MADASELDEAEALLTEGNAKDAESGAREALVLAATPGSAMARSKARDSCSGSGRDPH